jgi:glycerol-1-phosphate dehydrogenase [NAD(P)+]
MRRHVEDAFGWLDADGGAVAECWSDYAAKLEAWTAGRPRLVGLARAWPEHRSVLERLLVPPEVLADALRRAGAPTRFRDLDPPVDEATARWALRSCHLMRNRFTVADLAFLTGAWDDAFVERILGQAAELGAGL